MKQSRLVRTLGRVLKSDAQALRSEIERLWLIRSRSGQIDRFMRSHSVRRLHIGAGRNVLEGWLNTDLQPQAPGIIFLDVTDPLPFPDRSLDVVFSEHLIEHLSHADGAYHLREAFRVLKPHGRLRVATPDLQFLIDIYTRGDHTDAQARYVRLTVERMFPVNGFYSGAFVLNNFVRHWGHQFIYDESTLGDALRRAGFSNVTRWDVGRSDEPMLQNLEHHGDAISDDFNRMQTIVMEGNRPA